MNEYITEIKTGKSFDDTVVSLLKSIDKNGWAIFQVIDLRDRLAAKDFSIRPLKIIEICKASHASKLLSQNSLIAACMPCRLAVFEDDEGVKIISMNPSAMSNLFDGIDNSLLKIIQSEMNEIMRAVR